MDITDEAQKLKCLIEYMDKKFGVTPENIDEKLEELKKNLNERRLRAEMLQL